MAKVEVLTQAQPTNHFPAVGFAGNNLLCRPVETPTFTTSRSEYSLATARMPTAN